MHDFKLSDWTPGSVRPPEGSNKAGDKKNGIGTRTNYQDRGGIGNDQ